MNWLKIGAKLEVNKAFSTIASGVNNLGLTAQESGQLTAQFAKDTMSENSERSKARRFIAKSIVINTLVFFWVCVIAFFLNIEIDKLIELFTAFQLGWAFVTTIIFYLGGYYAKMIKGDKKG